MISRRTGRIDLRAGFGLVRDIVLGTTGEHDAGFAAETGLLGIEAGVLPEDGGERVLSQRALAFVPGEVQHASHVRTGGAARLALVESRVDTAVMEGDQGDEPCWIAADDGDLGSGGESTGHLSVR